ncbi:MAG: DNA-processing protein DprA [Candidatus Omnitrophica bacterium]|nr:DNA-processing protein DprA [Candidatus Omnitrophota bacterium]
MTQRSLSDSEALIGLNMVPGIGALRLKKCIEAGIHPADIFSVSEKALSSIDGIGGEIASHIRELKKNGLLERELEAIASSGICVLTLFDEAYPFLLRQIPDPPCVLYVAGDTGALAQAGVAVVGSRRATFYGLEQASRIAAQLARLSIVVVSGLARGIDTASHEGALGAGGRTVAVLGSGLNRVYPDENRGLARRIEREGAVISELPLDYEPLPFNFPRRNRIISGLSKAVIVVEASRRSGALLTASCALDQGREVFAVPGQVTSPNSEGTNALIKEGARLFTDISDMLSELGSALSVGPEHSTEDTAGRSRSQNAVPISLTDEEDTVYRLLSSRPADFDSLLQQSGLCMRDLMYLLLQLQVKHLIRELPGKRFAREIF